MRNVFNNYKIFLSPKVNEKVILFTICSFFFSCLNETAFAQNQEKLTFEHITVDDGLVLDNETRMYRDPYGYLWIGGEALERYDGYEFYNYNTDTQDTLSPEGNVMCVAMDSVGDLWMGAYGGINRYFYQRGYFKRYNYAYDENNQQYPLPPAVLDVIIDKAGEVWIASGGIYKYNPGKDYFDVVPYNLQGLDEEYIFNDEAVSAYSPIRDEIYIGVNYYGLLIYSIKDKNTRFLPSGQITGHPSSEYQDILVDKQGKVWVATVSHGAIVYDPFTDSFTQYTIEPGKTDDHTSVNYPDIRSLGLMYNGKVALGTDSKGLNIFDPETGLFEYYLHDYKNPNSIATNGVTNIITGPQNILWLFCFDGGISYYDPNWKRFEHYRKTGKYENELTDNTITGFAEDNTGNIWITTKEGGVNYWNRIQEKFMHTEFLNARTNKPVKNFQAVTRDADGDIWFGSADAGIFRYSPRLNDTIHYYHSENTNSPSGDDVTGIVTDHKGRVWISYQNAVNGGLDYFDPEKEQFMHYANTHENDIPDNWYNAGISLLMTDESNNLWIGLNGQGMGRISLDNPDLPIVFYSLGKQAEDVEFFDAVHDVEKNLLIISTSQGLFQFNYKKNKIKKTDTGKEDLNTMAFRSMLKDTSNFYWLTSESGLIKTDRDFKQVTTYTIEEGIQGNRFFNASKLITSRGEFILGGNNGFNLFIPSNIQENKYLPPVFITKIEVNNREINQFNADSLVSKAIGFVDSLELHYDQNTLGFSFVGLNFTMPQYNKYRYKMQGLQKDWVEIGSQRNVSFADLPPGDYTFMVQASNNDGIWNPEPASIFIDITPPWWRTWWFYSILGFMVFAAILTYLRIREKEQKQDQKLIQNEISKGEAEIAEQKRIVQELEAELKEKEKAEFELRWQNKGAVKFGEIINNSRDSIDMLLTSFNKALLEYLETKHTAIYLRNDEGESEKVQLLLKASTQNDSKNNINELSFYAGEGLVGICYLDKEIIQVNDVPATYLTGHSSGVIKDKNLEASEHLTLIPLKQDEFLEGVIEICSAEKLADYKIQFLEKIAGELTATVVALRTSSNIEAILQKAEEQRQLLQEQEKQLTEKLQQIRLRHEIAAKEEKELELSIQKQLDMNAKYKQHLS